MALTFAILLAVLIVIAWGLTFFLLPGNWVMLGLSGLYALFFDFQGGDDKRFLLILLGLAALGEGLEQFVLFIRNKQAQVPFDVVIAAIISGLIGAIIGVPIPFFGSLVGLLVGIFTGAFLYAYSKTREWQSAMRLARSALFSQLLATAVKLLLGFGMLVYIFVQLF